MIDIVPIDYNGPAVAGPRIRQLDQWILCHYSDGVPYLKGITVVEAGNFLNDRLRFTKTSPIVKIEERIAITESGSRYELLTALNPDDDQGNPVLILDQGCKNCERKSGEDYTIGCLECFEALNAGRDYMQRHRNALRKLTDGAPMVEPGDG